MISICCVGFASLDVVCDKLNDCAWNVGLWELSHMCVYVNCVESFSHIECYSDCSRRESHLVELLCYSAVTVECCVLYPCSVGVFGMFAVMQGRMLFSSILAITERRDMNLHEVPLFMSLLGFGMGTMLANFHMCGIMLVLSAVFSILVRNASTRGPMCFRCLMFSLS